MLFIILQFLNSYYLANFSLVESKESENKYQNHHTK